jgi:kynurenine formamidase
MSGKEQSMRYTALLPVAGLALLCGAAPAPPEAQPIDLGSARVVDLTHAFDKDTIYWPTSPSGFELKPLHEGLTGRGFYYSAYAFCAPEHGGTHLDAPVHFAKGTWTNAEIPVNRFIRGAVVIDISEKAAKDPDYTLSAEDVTSFEAAHGKIAPGTAVLLRTRWSKRWPDKRLYLGDDTPGDASNLHFPSYGIEAATLLIRERQVSMIGVDTASIDPGTSQDFPVHRFAAANGVVGIENLADLDALPPTGATVIALPMKIAGGSGGPARVVALLPAVK